MGLFNSKKAPATVPTDTIIPLHSRDDVSPVCNRRLHSEIRRCLGRGAAVSFTGAVTGTRGVEEIRGDVAVEEYGKLEYHVPEQYGAKRPGFTCKVVEHEVDIESHPEASALPTRGASEPSICTSLKRFDTHFGKSDAPSILDDWIYTDRPALDIYISKFTNAILVRVTWLHVYLEATALKGLFNGWMAVLRGCEEEVPPFYEFSEDPVASLGVDSKPEKWIC